MCACVPPVELQAFQPSLPSPHHLSLTYRPHYSSPTDNMYIFFDKILKKHILQTKKVKYPLMFAWGDE